MTIRKGFLKDDYTRINNRIAQDKSISLEARGVWVDLATRPDDWTILPKYMAKENGIGRDKMYKLLNELITAGVCQREQARQKTKDGREVLGKMEYVIYNDYVPLEERVEKKSVRPGFQDTEIQCPDSQYTDEPYTTNKRLKEKKEEKQLPLTPSSKETPNKNHEVVVSPEFSDLGGTARDMERLLLLFEEDEILKACELAKSQGSVIHNLFGWIKDCIEQGYKKTPSKADNEEKNKRILRDCFGQLDGKKIGSYAITVGPTYIEFYGGGVNGGKVIKISDPDFEGEVRAYIKRLREAFNGS